ncbi:N-acetyltransferase [Bacteroidia bacterium]|nr:N-acetyltransferase [Bacteroidia bacterium]
MEITDFWKNCNGVALSGENRISGFDCGNDDLNEFFNVDAIKYQEQMLGQTYFFQHTESQKIVCAFSLSPDSIKLTYLPNSRRKKVQELIPREKPLQTYPAFLIGRLGVASDLKGKGIGSQLIIFIKSFCLGEFPNFCRFLLLDAYNEPAVLSFYLKNEFKFVFSTEHQEREYYKKVNLDEPLRTRLMFYDMMLWKEKLVSINN